jgi:hypothetical protein
MSRYQLFEPLLKSDYLALKDDISRRGILVPIELDEAGEVLDGHHRLRAAEELGITDYPVVVRALPSEQHKELHVIALNLHRRHLAKPKRKRWIFEEAQLTIEIGDEPRPEPSSRVHSIKSPATSPEHATERQRSHRLRERLRPRHPVSAFTDPWELANSLLLLCSNLRPGISNPKLLATLDELEEGIRQLAWGPED